MSSPLSPGTWVAALGREIKREWGLHQLKDERFRYLWAPPPADEWVVFDCETTGLDPAVDRITAIAAVRIQGSKLLTSERLELTVLHDPEAVVPQTQAAHPDAQDERHFPSKNMTIEAALQQLLPFVGSRPLVGYFLDFDLALINRAALPCLGVPLPLQRLDVSAMFYDWKFRQWPAYPQPAGARTDLRFATLMRELGLPERPTPSALDNAVLAGLAFIKLRRLLGFA